MPLLHGWMPLLWGWMYAIVAEMDAVHNSANCVMLCNTPHTLAVRAQTALVRVLLALGHASCMISCTNLLHQPRIKAQALQEEDQNGKPAGADEEEEDEGIEAQPDEGGSREAGEEVVTLEQCLAWGGEQRQRCRLTMSVSGASCTQPATPACSLHVHPLCVLSCTATL